MHFRQLIFFAATSHATSAMRDRILDERDNLAGEAPNGNEVIIARFRESLPLAPPLYYLAPSPARSATTSGTYCLS